MHPEIDKLINMALLDGHVTDKEREIILRKAEKLGLDVDELEMYLEGLISSSLNSKSSNINIEEGNLIKLEINDSYIEKDDLIKIVENISQFERRIKEVEQYYLQNFNSWVKNDFLEKIKSHPEKIELDELNFLINASSFLSGKKYKEGSISSFLNRIINDEGFIGFFAIDYSLISINELKSNLSNSDRYKRLLFTNKAVYFFDKNFYDIINKRFICSSVSYESIKSPEIYNLNIHNCSTDKIIHKIVFDSIESNHNLIMENNGIGWTDDSYKLDFLGKSNINSFNFLHLFSLDNLNKISFDDLIINLKTVINFNKFKSILNQYNLSESQNINLLKINNYIENFLFNFNSFLTHNEKNIYYYSYLKETNKNSFSKYEFLNSLGNSVCTPKINNALEMIISNYKFSMTHTIVILDLRDKLLNCYLNNNSIDANEIMLKIDNYGVFLTKFERTSIEKLDEINKSLHQLNNTLMEGFSMISSSIESLNNNLQNIKNSIDKIDLTLDIGNFVQIIQSYQLYRINKNNIV